MNLTDAQRMAHSLMNEHGYGHIPIKFNRSVTSLGKTHFFGRKGQTGAWKITAMSLSKQFVELLDEAEIRNVILHEIAHMMVGPYPPGGAHGPVWKAAARRVGAAPKSCQVPSASPTAPYEGVCAKGHKSHTKMHRHPQRLRFCIKCFDKTKPYDSLFAWYKNGRRVPLMSAPVKYRKAYNSLLTRSLRP